MHAFKMTHKVINEDDVTTVAEQNAADECDLLITDDKRHLNRHSKVDESGNRLFGKLLFYLGTNSSSRPTSPQSQSLKFTLKHDNQKVEHNDTIYNYLEDYSYKNEVGQSKVSKTKVRIQHGLDEADRRRRIICNKSNGWKLRSLLISFSCCVISLVVFIFLLGELLILVERKSPILDGSYTINPDQLNSDKRSRWIVASSKCHIPQLEAWHESIQKYVQRKKPLNCSLIASNNGLNQSSFSFVHGNRLHLTSDALEKGNCCMQEITRQLLSDKELSYNKTCIPINKTDSSVPFELIKVNCPKENYTNVHSFMLHHNEEEESLNRLVKKKLIKNDYFNVLMLGMDTISRLNGYRQLNRTLELLHSKFKTIEFVGYNKVGENTFPNLIPLLTGLKPEQLTETHCWQPSNYSNGADVGDDYLDNCKYLWNYYRDLGYITYYSEDWPKASTFNYLKPGFKRQPTSFYGRPATIARDSLLLPPVNMGCASCLLDRPLVEVDLTTLKSFIQEYHNRPYFAFHWVNCPQHDDLNGASEVDHIVRKFLNDVHKITQNERTFVVFFSDHGYRWNDFVSTRIGHYESSLPMLTIAPPKKFIKKYPNLYKNLLNHMRALITPFDLFKTIIDIRNLGLVSNASQSSMKLLHNNRKREAISTSPVPRKVIEKKKINNTATTITSTTTTQTSVNKTDQSVLLETFGPTAATIIRQQEPQDGLNFKQSFKAFSLFAKHNSSELDRSCSEAGIPDNFCVCHEFETIDLSRTDVLGASYYLVYVHLYGQLLDHDGICQLLDLDKVADAQVFDFKRMKSSKITRRKRASQTKDVELRLGEPVSVARRVEEIVIDEHHYLPNREYNIRVVVKPGGGLFQEVIRFYGDDIELCNEAVERASLTINDIAKNHRDKHNSVMKLNEICKFSIHSVSISRLNLYKDQSKCVKSNIELKKVCYCKT